MGGSIGIGTHAKRYRLAQLALQERVPLVMLLEGAGERAQNAFERYPHAAERPPGAGPAPGRRAHGRGGHGRERGARRAHRPAHGLRRHGGGRGAVQRRPAARRRRDRRGGDEGGARWRRGAHHDLGRRAQRRRRRRRRARCWPAGYLGYFPDARRWPAALAPDGTTALGGSTRSSTSCPPTRAARTTCGGSWSWSPTTATCSRSSRRSGAPWSPRSCGSAACRWPSWPTTRRSRPAPSTATPRTRRRASSVSSDRSSCRCVFLADNPGVLAGTVAEQLGHPARRGPDVRRPGERARSEAARDAAQGVRLRLVAHGDEPVRRPDHHARVPGRAPRRDAGRERRRRRGHRARRARRCSSTPSSAARTPRPTA